LDIPLRRRLRVLICLLKFANHNHSTNIIQSDDIIFAGSGNTLGLKLNQTSTQLEVFLSPLRHSMALIAIGAAQSCDNLA
jgi:alkylation response protein AidB-like acyl-CoA dehydrogenase